MLSKTPSRRRIRDRAAEADVTKTMDTSQVFYSELMQERVIKVSVVRAIAAVSQSNSKSGSKWNVLSRLRIAIHDAFYGRGLFLTV